MSRTAFIAGVLAASLALPLCAVDLNRPGALDELRQARPAHYLAVTQILRVAEHAPCPAGQLEVLRARYDVREMACSFLLMTSYPAKRRLDFVLEGTPYVAVVTLKDSDARLIPADLRVPVRR